MFFDTQTVSLQLRKRVQLYTGQTTSCESIRTGMDSKTLSTLLGHYSVAFTLDTYTHVLDSQKHEEIKLMEDLFSILTVSQHQSYPVVVTPVPSGFIFNAVDFEGVTVEADNIQYGISYIQSAIVQKLTAAYPPSPTPNSELVLNIGEFIVMINA